MTQEQTAASLLLRVAKDLLAWDRGVQDAKDYRQLLFKARVAVKCASACGIKPFDHEGRWMSRRQRS